MKYIEKLKDPRWQKKRLEILSRDQWTCQNCHSTEDTLAVHHLIYNKGYDPWDYNDSDLVTLCESCHDHESKNIAVAAEHLINAVKRSGFLSDDINILAKGFSAFTMKHAPHVAAEVLQYTLGNNKIIDELYKEFFDHLKKKMEGMRRAEIEEK